MIYFDAESPAVQALSFVKEVSDGVLDGSIEFFCDLTIVLRAKQHFVLIACPVITLEFIRMMIFSYETQDTIAK
jgi:hypothetical protein